MLILFDTEQHKYTYKEGQEKEGRRSQFATVMERTDLERPESTRRTKLAKHGRRS